MGVVTHITGEEHSTQKVIVNLASTRQTSVVLRHTFLRLVGILIRSFDAFGLLSFCVTWFYLTSLGKISWVFDRLPHFLIVLEGSKHPEEIPKWSN